MESAALRKGVYSICIVKCEWLEIGERIYMLEDFIFRFFILKISHPILNNFRMFFFVVASFILQRNTSPYKYRCVVRNLSLCPHWRTYQPTTTKSVHASVFFCLELRTYVMWWYYILLWWERGNPYTKSNFLFIKSFLRAIFF